MSTGTVGLLSDWMDGAMGGDWVFIFEAARSFGYGTEMLFVLVVEKLLKTDLDCCGGKCGGTGVDRFL